MTWWTRERPNFIKGGMPWIFIYTFSAGDSKIDPAHWSLVHAWMKYTDAHPQVIEKIRKLVNVK
jgi:hypothetical protein